jgi:hypothetical protein
MTHAYGLGLFCEVGAKQWTITVPPYISAHGSFVAALLYQFVSTDCETNGIGLFTSAHRDYLARQITLRRVRCCGDITVDVTRSDTRLSARFAGNGTVMVRAKLPRQIPRELLHITVNGAAAAAEIDFKTGEAAVKADIAGTLDLEIY